MSRAFTVVLQLVAWLSVAAAISYSYDETLWTKQLWHKWKVENPLAHLNPTQENPKLLEAFPELKDVSLNSLDGPIPRRDKASSLAEGLSTFKTLFEAEAVADKGVLQPAATAAKCSMCHALVTYVWQRLVVSLLTGEQQQQPAAAAAAAAGATGAAAGAAGGGAAGGSGAGSSVGVGAGDVTGALQAPSQRLVRDQLVGACDKAAPNFFLAKHTIYKVEGEDQRNAMVFFVVRERKAKAAPTLAERAAAQLACKMVLRSGGEELASAVGEHLATYVGQLQGLLAKYGIDTSALKPGTAAAAAGGGGKQQQALPAGSGAAGEAGAGSSGTSSAGGASASASVPAAAGDATAGGAGDATASAGGAAASGSGGGDDAALTAALDEPLLTTSLAELGAGVDADEIAAAIREAEAAQAGPDEARAGDARRQLAAVMHKVLKGLQTRLKADGFEFDLGSGGSALGADDDEEDDDDEDDADCMDLHPMCRQWADEGECDANPNYMVGSDTARGHCRRSCGVCQPVSAARLAAKQQQQQQPDVLTQHPELAAELETLSDLLLRAVRNTGCAQSKACMTSLPGTSAGAGGASKGAAAAAKGEGVAEDDDDEDDDEDDEEEYGGGGASGGVSVKPRVGTGYTLASSGFELNKPTWGVPRVVAAQQQQQPAAAAAAAAQSKGAAGAAGGEGGDEVAAAVEAALGPELAGKALRLQGEYFVFEYVYHNHTRHYHQLEDGGTSEDWILGRFQRESPRPVTAAGEPAVLEVHDLMPDLRGQLGRKSWPYVKQVYAAGDECVLAGGKRVVRRTEVRVACSPDAHLHFLIREPDFCHYVFVVYSPALCHVPAFKALDRPTAGSGASTGGKPAAAGAGAGRGARPG